jgi:hypothetical protein
MSRDWDHYGGMSYVFGEYGFGNSFVFFETCNEKGFRLFKKWLLNRMMVNRQFQCSCNLFLSLYDPLVHRCTYSQRAVF